MPFGLVPCTRIRTSTAVFKFIDLEAQQRRFGAVLPAVIQQVLAHGMFILGPEVAEFEACSARLCGVRHAVSCANGTDALVGVTPLFADIDPDTFNIATADAAPTSAMSTLMPKPV